MKNIKNKEYLIIGDLGSRIYANKPLCRNAILRKVKKLTGYTTTQAYRYGRFEEYLLEEEIKAQRD